MAKDSTPTRINPFGGKGRNSVHPFGGKDRKKNNPPGRKDWTRKTVNPFGRNCSKKIDVLWKDSKKIMVMIV